MKLLKRVYSYIILFYAGLYYRLRHILKTFTLKGVRLYIDDDKILSKAVLMSVLRGGYEDKENKIIREHLNPADTVLELGAGLGFNSIAAAKINAGKIISYESNPKLIPLIKRNQKLNKVAFEVRNKILVNDSSRGKTMTFFISENASMSSVKNYKAAGHVVTETIQVETVNAGEVLVDLSPQFLIMDIEGGEEEFFNQPGLLKESSVQKIMVEIHPEIIGDAGATAVIRNIVDAGFNLVTESSMGSVLFFRRD